MATNKNVIILVPNGRRQNVKVTGNTTILQVLEEVCQKHGYNVDDYDLKHFNKMLDPNAILRFTGLSNNAQLEMVPCTKTRKTSSVTIGIQLENGERLMGEFTPNTTLVEVLQNLKLDQNLEQIALSYMHCEIYGIDNLRNTTLKSLGLNNGKAVLRLLHRKPQDVNVTVPTPSEPLESTENLSTNNDKIVPNEPISSVTPLQEDKPPKKLEACSQNVEDRTEIIIKTDEEHKDLLAGRSESVDKDTSAQTSYEHERNDINEIEFLGERNALVFNHATMQPISRSDLPDNFFELTVEDARILLRDVARHRKKLEEAPLTTNVQRQMNEEKRTLDQLNKYRYTIIRIHFPDQFVLQGLFQPMETIQMVKDFVKNYLTDANTDFAIFTTPPKCILNPDASLINEKLVPCANVYYSGSSALKPDIKQKVMDPIMVEMQVAQIRKSMIKQEDETSNNDAKTKDTTSGKPVPNIRTDDSLDESKIKIPKWLNLPFK